MEIQLQTIEEIKQELMPELEGRVREIVDKVIADIVKEMHVMVETSREISKIDKNMVIDQAVVRVLKDIKGSTGDSGRDGIDGVKGLDAPVVSPKMVAKELKNDSTFKVMTRGEDGLDGEVGKTPTEAELTTLIKKALPKIEDIDIKKLVKDIEKLQGTDRLDYLKLRNLPVESVGKTKSVHRGGPSTVQTETPSGAINGSNVTYTVARRISSIASFGINGQMIHSDEFSTSGSTITFVTALPSALSATTFEIKYFTS